MELLSSAIADKTSPSKINDDPSHLGKSDGEQKPQHCQNDAGDISVGLSPCKIVPRGKFMISENNLTVNLAGKSRLPCLNNKSDNCENSSTLSRNRTDDSDSGDHAKHKQSENSQQKKQTTLGADTEVRNEVRTELEGSLDNVAELTSYDQRRNNANNDSDDELEEFVFTARNNKPPTTALL